VQGNFNKGAREMLKKIGLGLVVAVTGLMGMQESVQAQDPFAFQFGYALGFQNSFRNRLPTPPYFAIHPPVYYGQRYARPYGESPYASWPLLRSSPSYHAVPAEGHFVRPHVMDNPHAHGHHGDTPRVKVSEEAGHAPIAHAPIPQPAVVIINPFSLEQYAKK
jgi:hypothetical protein